MYCRKALFINHIATRGKCTVSWNGIWFSVPWLGPMGCQKNSTFLVRSGKQGETEKEGGLHGASSLPATLIFMETRSVLLFDVKRKPHKHSWSERLHLKIQQIIWNLWSLSFSLFPSLLQNSGTEGEKTAGLCCAQPALQNSAALGSTICLQ